MLPAIGFPRHAGARSPFSTTSLIAVDTLRFVIIVLAIMLFFAFVKVLINNYREKNWPNFCFIALMTCSQFVYVDGEYSHLGFPMNSRLPIILVGELFGIAALVLRRRWRQAHFGISGVQSRDT